MHQKDNRAEHLGWVEVALRCEHPDLPNLRITAQSHFGLPDRIAFIAVFGIDADRARRRQIRADARVLLERLGYSVEIEPGRDVHDIEPVRPTSAHDELRILQCLLTASGVSGPRD